MPAREDILRDSLINRDGDHWKSRRAMIRPFFARERLIDFEVIEKFTQKTLDVLSNYPADLPIDIQDLFARFTLDAGSTFVSDFLALTSC
jgi:cytochrome P450